MKKILIIVGALVVVGLAAFYWRGNIQDIPLELAKQQLPTEIKNVPTSSVTVTSSKFAST
jgi:uncharacterized protein YxeA